MKKILIVVVAMAFLVMLTLSALAEQGEQAAPTPPQKAVPRVVAKAPAKTPAKAAVTEENTNVPVAESQQTEEQGSGEGQPDQPEGEAPVNVASLPVDTAGFVEVMREQIVAVGGRPTCDEQSGRCFYRHRGEGNEGSHEIQLWYSGVSRTIYVFVNHLADATETNAATPTILRHLAALNRVMDVARFEWNPADGEVRLSTVVNVDTNLDRRALRSLLQMLQEAAVRYQSRIAGIASDHENAGDLPLPVEDRQGSSADRHGYMAAIEEELRALNISPTCVAGEGRCTYEVDSEEARNVFPFVIRYNDQSHTITVAIDHYLTAPRENPRTDRLLQRTLELNWEQLAPMFQWDAGAGRVRLAAVINTDSNFDRRAFRGVVQAMHQTSARRYRELRTLLNP